jgi:SagB-type dehydrogenase family enzyme
MRRRRPGAGPWGLIVLLLAAGITWPFQALHGQEAQRQSEVVNLPEPALDGTLALEAAIAKRRSVREFGPGRLTAAQIGQLAWAAQGITDAETGHRACPSAGATYPLELYFVTPDGLLHYVPDGHRMERLAEADVRPKLREAGWRQRQIAEAPLAIIMAAVYERTAARFGERGTRYVQLEAGHVGQNIQLQAAALGLASVPIGVSDDDGRVRAALDLPEDQEMVYVVCVGRAKE